MLRRLPCSTLLTTSCPTRRSSDLRLLLDTADDVHALQDAAECAPALAVIKPLAAEVERRLVVEADEEIGSRAVGRRRARHRHGAGDVFQDRKSTRLNSSH